jgi:hypothetical protein
VKKIILILNQNFFLEFFSINNLILSIKSMTKKLLSPFQIIYLPVYLNYIKEVILYPKLTLYEI